MAIDSNPNLVKIVPTVDLVPLAPLNIMISLSSIIILKINANRKGLWIKSLAIPPNRISIAFGNNKAVLERGITLEPNQVFQMDVLTFTTQQINAIGSAISNLALQEYT